MNIKVLALAAIVTCIPALSYRPNKNGSVPVLALDELEDISDTLKAIKAELIEIKKELKQTKKDPDEKVIVNCPVK